jgi:hypothetical protein
MGLHRYDRAQGFEPKKLKIEGFTFEDAYRRACAAMGGEQPQTLTSSVEWPNWSGPYAVAMSWAS